MIALIGYSRFPIFYSGNKILGSKSGNIYFDDYVRSLDKSIKSVVIHTISNVKMRGRFVVNKQSINPFLSVKEDVPGKIYNYPCREGDEVLKNMYTYGIIFKGARNHVYLPLLPIRELEKKEADSLLNVATVKKLSFDKMVQFIRDMGIDVDITEMVDYILFKVNDPNLNSEYEVHADKNGRVVDTNFCIDMSTQLYLPELIMLTRQQGRIHVFSD